MISPHHFHPTNGVRPSDSKNRFIVQNQRYHLISRIHFSRYYMTPLIEKGLVARTDPENPMSPRQEYKLT